MRVTDFIALSRATRDQPGPDTHDRLWRTWFALPQWHFIKVPSPSGWLPFSGFVNGLRCVLAFTAANRADGYARFAALIHPGVASPVMSLAPAQAIQLAPQLRMWGVTGIVVDTGPDGFYAPLDSLVGMFRRYGNSVPAPPPPHVTLASPMMTLDALLALPAWHVVTTKDDPTFPDFAVSGTDLVAQIYSRADRVPGNPRPPTAVMTPTDVLSLLSDIELVALVRFDNQLEVQFVDLKLRSGAG